MFNRILLYIQRLWKKVKGSYTARPRILRFEGGEVTLKNFSVERAEELIKLLQAPVGGSTQILEDKTEQRNDEREDSNYTIDSTLDSTAYGVCKDSNGIWNLVEVRYNLDTKQARVDSVLSTNKDKGVVSSDFRVQVAKKIF